MNVWDRLQPPHDTELDKQNEWIDGWMEIYKLLQSRLDFTQLLNSSGIGDVWFLPSVYVS